MTDYAGVVRRSLSAETAAEFDRRVAEQADRLTDAIETGQFDNDAFTVGLELEAYAVDDEGRLAELPEDVFEGPAAKELGLHNAELNAAPSPFDEGGIADQAATVEADLAATRERAADHGLEIVLDAMWTLPPRSGARAYLDDVVVDVGSDDAGVPDGVEGPDGDPVVPGPDADDPVVFARNMRRDPRYTALDNEALRRAEGVLGLSVPCADQSFRTILFESLATSIQPHVQVPTADAFPRYHNLAVRTLGPLLALATNSPFLPVDCYGDVDPERVVDETHHELRIAAFEQSMNQACRKVRVPDDLDDATDVVDHVVADDTYAPFLREWLADEGDTGAAGDADGVGEESDADAAGDAVGPSAEESVTVDDCWELDYKRSTFWRWVRGVACGDAVDGACDERSLRIEYRPLPTQPTVRDVVGLQVLTAGLVRGLAVADHPLAELDWEDARASFYAAVADGLDADLAWVTADGVRTGDADAVFDEVFAYARRGLAEQGVSPATRDRYLDPLEARWERGVTPSVWKKRRVRRELDDGADLDAAIAAMQRDYVSLSRECDAFVDWLD